MNKNNSNQFVIPSYQTILSNNIVSYVIDSQVNVFATRGSMNGNSNYNDTNIIILLPSSSASATWSASSIKYTIHIALEYISIKR